MTPPNSFASILIPFFFAPLLVAAQFGSFFDQMFQGSGGGGGGGGGGGRQSNVASDSAWYRNTYEGATCSNYLCPGTLACVDKPTHCPCAWPDVEEKYELHPDGLALCISRGKLADRKVELARKGLI